MIYRFKQNKRTFIGIDRKCIPSFTIKLCHHRKGISALKLQKAPKRPWTDEALGNDQQRGGVEAISYFSKRFATANNFPLFIASIAKLKRFRVCCISPATIPWHKHMGCVLIK